MIDVMRAHTIEVNLDEIFAEGRGARRRKEGGVVVVGWRVWTGAAQGGERADGSMGEYWKWGLEEAQEYELFLKC